LKTKLLLLKKTIKLISSVKLKTITTLKKEPREKKKEIKSRRTKLKKNIMYTN
jgi:hypothetical protein